MAYGGLAAALFWTALVLGAPKEPPAPTIPSLPPPPALTLPEAEGRAASTEPKEEKPKAPSAPGATRGEALPGELAPEETPETGGSAPMNDRYKVILIRNPFGLNPPKPPEPPPPPPPPEPDLDIYLTGISTLLGKQRAFLKTDDPKEKDKAKKFRYYSLKVGEAKDDLEIVSIDIDAGDVTIKFKGETKELNLKENGIQPVAAAPAAAAGKPGQPGAAGRKLPPGMNTTAARTATRVTPSVTRVTPQAGAATVNPSSTANRNVYNRSASRPPAINVPARSTSSGASGVRQLQDGKYSVQLPTRPTRSSSGPLLPPPPKVDPVEQKILIELNREVNQLGREQQDLVMPPLPPTGN